MFSSLLRYGIEGIPCSSSPSAVQDPSARTSPGDTGTTVVLPHRSSWATSTPPQAQPLPVLEFRLELVEESTCGCHRRTVARPPCREDDADPPNADSSSTNTTVLVNLRTLGLDSVLPHNSPDFTIAAVKLGRASRARAEVLHEVDRAVEDLQVLVDSFNNTNENVAFSASLYEAVRHYHSCPKISQVMTDLVNALHPLEVSQT